MKTSNGTQTETIHVEEEQTPTTNYARKLVLAGLGVVAVGQETTTQVQKDLTKWFDKLVDRGEKVEKEGRKMFKKLVKSQKKQMAQMTDRTEAQVEKRLEEVITRMNIPTRDDLKTLTTKINLLSQKVEDLKKASVAA